MAEARAVKFCTKGDYIKSCQRDDKSPLKGDGYGQVTYLNSWFPYDISGTVKGRDLKFCSLVSQVSVQH